MRVGADGRGAALRALSDLLQTLEGCASKVRKSGMQLQRSAIMNVCVIACYLASGFS
jgi:hypothetical protein